MGSKSRNKKNMTKPDGDATVNHRNNGKIISDARFASLHSDPRFREPPKHRAKVAIDSRFNRMFTDKNFAASKARTDKRGKLKKNDSAANPLKHYYRLEEEEDEEGGAKERRLGKELVKNEESGEIESEDVESDEEIESENVKGGTLKLENESETSDSDEEEEEEDESDDSMSTTSDSDEEDEAYEEEEDTFGLEETVPEIDKETHRLAVVNMDWSQVKAVDLHVLLSSFLPRGGQIMSVAVYPSEFGLKQMEEEAIHGPVGLFEDDEKNNQNDEDEDEDDDEIDNEKLRAYELSRLRYYYAVVECDSIATADYLYRTCDGVEFERSSTKLDLRFVPDTMEFKHQPRDVAKHSPADYDGLDFETRALQQSKIHLTWDDDEPQRAKTLKRKFNDDQLAELEFQEYLASDASDSDESENDDGSSEKQKKQDMYRALLQLGDGSDENDDKDQDMEVTFNAGLEDLSKRILEKKDRKSENVWDALLRKRREKKKARKNRLKDSSEDESMDTDNEPAEETDDFFLEEPSGKENKAAQGRNARKEKQNEDASQEAEASRAELELLLADDKGADSSLKGYNLKRKKMKGKKGKEIPDEGKLPTIDYDDPRFSGLFTSPLFALDPTDPQFKRSAAYARQMANRQQKSESENKRVKEPSETLGQGFESSKTHDDDNGRQPTSKKEKQELSSLVRSIKMKSKQLPLHGKVLENTNNLKIKAKKSKWVSF